MNRTGYVMAAAALVAAILGLAPGLCRAAEAGTDYVLVIDCSGTMRYSGRAAATEAAIGELVNGMASGDRLSVYGYGEGAWPALAGQPVTIGDPDARRAISGAIDLVFDDDRTDITAGLSLAWSERSRVLPAGEGRGARRGCVILLTDGKLIPVYDDFSAYQSVYDESRARLLELAALFGKSGIPVHTIGLGKTDSVDGELLSLVSKASGGDYRGAPTTGALSGAFDAIAERIAGDARVAAAETAPPRPDEAAEAGERGAEARDRSAGAGGQSAEAGEQSDSSGEHLPGFFTRILAAAGRSSAYPGAAYQISTAALGVLMGFVAMGMQRRQSWASVFTRPIGHTPVRVKGYLKPMVPEGVTMPRACVPLENPGLETVTIGAGGEFLTELTATAVEVLGAPDGGPPVLKMLKGTITVDGETVSEMRKLSDGNLIEIEGRKYVYLRGCRR